MKPNPEVEKLLQLGQPHAALPIAEFFVQQAPNNAHAWAQLGQVLMLLKQPQHAMRVLERALQLDSKLASAQTALAAACFECHDEERGMQLLRQTLLGEQLDDRSWLLAAQHLVAVQMRVALLEDARSTLQMVADRLRRLGQIIPAWLTSYQTRLASCWWQMHQGRRVRIRRAQPTDAAWLKSCFDDEQFAKTVNREYACRLSKTPESVLALQLQSQLHQSPVDFGSVLWLIERIDQNGYQAIGLAGFANIDLNNLRAEFSIGYKEPLPPSTMVIESGFLLADFFFRQLGMRKATVSIYEDNHRRKELIDILQRLGFRSEGVLRQQVRVGKRFLDLHMLGGLSFEVLSNESFQRCAQRFLNKSILVEN